MRDVDRPTIRTRAARRLIEWAGHALEGEHSWGYIDVVPAGRTAWQLKRLTVYPPGTTVEQRRLLKFHRDWPINGAVLALFLIFALGDAWPMPLAATTVVLVYVCGVSVTSRLTHHLRMSSRRLHVTSTAGEQGCRYRGDVDLFESARAELLRLDAGRVGGELTPAQFEAGWARVFDRLAESVQA